MRDALSAKEIAALKLPGVNPCEPSSIIGTPQGVSKIAKRHGWGCEIKPLSNGGRERVYPISSLPQVFAKALMDAVSSRIPAVCTVLGVRIEADGPAPLPAEVVHSPSLPAEALPLPASLADWQRRSLEARLALLAEVDRLSVAGTWRKAAVLVETKAKDGTLAPALLRLVPVANARSGGGEGERTLSLRTLYRWADLREQAAAADNWSILAPREPAKVKRARPWETALLSLYRQPQQRGIAWCLDEGWKRFPAARAPASRKTFREARRPTIEDSRAHRSTDASAPCPASPTFPSRRVSTHCRSRTIRSSIAAPNSSRSRPGPCCADWMRRS